MKNVNLVLPYSAKSFNGILADAITYIRKQGLGIEKIYSMCLPGEGPPDDTVLWRTDIYRPQWWDDGSTVRRWFLVANGGTTIQSWAMAQLWLAVNLCYCSSPFIAESERAKRLRPEVTVLNCQRDGVEILEQRLKW